MATRSAQANRPLSGHAASPAPSWGNRTRHVDRRVAAAENHAPDAP